MPKTIELIWLANVLICMGCMGVGWTLVGLLQRTWKAKASLQRRNRIRSQINAPLLGAEGEGSPDTARGSEKL
jgi:hypothetical protein